MAKSQEFKQIDSLLESINEKYGEGSVFRFKSNDNFSNIDRWELDSLRSMYLTNGGLPKGRMIEIYGPEGSGKTTRACYYASQVQKTGDLVAYLDVEHALDIPYAKTIGFDIEKAIFSQPDSGEQAINIAVELASSGIVKLIIIDSIAALTPLSELEGQAEDQQMGAQARLMGKACRKLSSIIGKNGCSMIWINQERMKIGVLYGNPSTTPGGMAIRYYSSIREEVRRKEFIEEGTGEKKKVIGLISTIKAVKNKVGIPFKKIEMKVIFGKGLQVEEEIVDFAVTTSVIQRKGTWFSYGEMRLGQGTENLIKYLKDNPDFYEKIKKETKDRLDPKTALETISDIPKEDLIEEEPKDED